MQIFPLIWVTLSYTMEYIQVDHQFIVVLHILLALWEYMPICLFLSLFFSTNFLTGIINKSRKQF